MIEATAVELRQIETFIQIAQLKSFSRAAECLGYSQAAVTIQVKQLERELGVRLFDRMHKRVQITAQGQIFLSHAHAILQELNRAQLALDESGELRGVLHVGTIESLCHSKLPPILRHFRQTHPEVAVRITTASPEELIAMMERNQVDLIYILDDPRYNNSWHKAMEQKEAVVFVASASLGLDRQGPLKLEALLDYPFFLTETEANYRRALDRYLASRQRLIHPAVESGNTEFIIKLLEQNAGISLLPLFAVQESAEAGRISILDVKDFHLSMYRQIFYHKEKWTTREMEEFIRLANLPENETN